MTGKIAIVRRCHEPGGCDFMAVWSELTDWEPVEIPGTAVAAGQPINRTLAIETARNNGWLLATEQVGS